MYVETLGLAPEQMFPFAEGAAQSTLGRDQRHVLEALESLHICPRGLGLCGAFAWLVGIGSAFVFGFLLLLQGFHSC